MSEEGKSVVAKTIADQTYRHMRRDIISGALAPGSKLAMEMLSKRYDVGLSPLREALVRLTGDALAVAEGQRGFWVSQISLSDLQDMNDARLLIEGQALALAIERGGEEWEQAVTKSHEELTVLERQLDRVGNANIALWESANRRFHEALVSACSSPWLLRLRNVLQQHAERYCMIALSKSMIARDVHDEHEAIFDAVLARKTLRACRLTEMHLQHMAEIVRAALERPAEAVVANRPRHATAGRGKSSSRR